MRSVWGECGGCGKVRWGVGAGIRKDVERGVDCGGVEKREGGVGECMR